jgi:hypothetical protein
MAPVHGNQNFPPPFVRKNCPPIMRHYCRKNRGKTKLQPIALLSLLYSLPVDQTRNTTAWHLFLWSTWFSVITQPGITIGSLAWSAFPISNVLIYITKRDLVSITTRICFFFFLFFLPFFSQSMLLPFRLKTICKGTISPAHSSLYYTVFWLVFVLSDPIFFVHTGCFFGASSRRKYGFYDTLQP